MDRIHVSLYMYSMAVGSGLLVIVVVVVVVCFFVFFFSSFFFFFWCYAFDILCTHKFQRVKFVL